MPAVVFVGDYSPQSMGDYVSGPNHVLPTGRSRAGARRFERDGFREGDYGAAVHAQGTEAAWARMRLRWLRLKVDRTRGECASEDDDELRLILLQIVEEAVEAAPGGTGDAGVSPAAGGAEALRLDFNENTSGAFAEGDGAAAAMTAEGLTKYPEREPVERIVAAALRAAGGAGAADEWCG